MNQPTTPSYEQNLETSQHLSSDQPMVDYKDITLNDMSSLNTVDSNTADRLFGSVELAVRPLDGNPPLNPNPNDQHPTKDS